MKADVGDRIVVASGAARPIRDGEVLQTGPDGGGPYLVRWSDSGNESLFSPVRTRMSSMSSGIPATLAVSRLQPARAQSRPRNGRSRSTCMKIRDRPTPCCTATYLVRSMFAVRLAAARLIRICLRSETK